jgi:phosphate transport system protein
MTHYEERLQTDLTRLREDVVAVGGKVQQAVEQAVRALLQMDRELAYATVLGDLPINREIRGLDHRCHVFVARHLPSSGHLRFVSSVLRLNVALERIGDYAAAISREAVQLSEEPPSTVARGIELLADQTLGALKQALSAFHDASAELARGTMRMADQTGRMFGTFYQDLLDTAGNDKRPIRDLFALLVIFNRLSRVAAQAKNICEETVFAATGETKAPKIYRILFVDETNDCVSQLATAFARKAFPESGVFESAGWNPATVVRPEILEFLEANGYDASDVEPRSLAKLAPSLADYHLIVSLQGDLRPHVAEIPFHTVVLEWNVGACADGVTSEKLNQAVDEVRQKITGRLVDLMETLRGEGAS